MGIPVGKLAIYTAGAGIYPALTLPVSLDVGTDNQALLADPIYAAGAIRAFGGQPTTHSSIPSLAGVTSVFPRAILQWEDFKQHIAIRILDRYRTCCRRFNDDIQGTASVVLAGSWPACACRRAAPRPALRVLRCRRGKPPASPGWCGSPSSRPATDADEIRRVADSPGLEKACWGWRRPRA